MVHREEKNFFEKFFRKNLVVSEKGRNFALAKGKQRGPAESGKPSRKAR